LKRCPRKIVVNHVDRQAKWSTQTKEINKKLTEQDITTWVQHTNIEHEKTFNIYIFIIKQRISKLYSCGWLPAPPYNLGGDLVMNIYTHPRPLTQE